MRFPDVLRVALFGVISSLTVGSGTRTATASASEGATAARDYRVEYGAGQFAFVGDARRRQRGGLTNWIGAGFRANRLVTLTFDVHAASFIPDAPFVPHLFRFEPGVRVSAPETGAVWPWVGISVGPGLAFSVCPRESMECAGGTEFHVFGAFRAGIDWPLSRSVSVGSVFEAFRTLYTATRSSALPPPGAPAPPSTVSTAITGVGFGVCVTARL